MNTLTKEKTSNGTATPQKGYLYPQVNIAETKDGYVLEADMPGVGKSGLEVLLEDNELTIVGHRNGDLPAGADALYRESANKDYRRSFVLDPAIDTNRITARMENGVLTLDLPKAEKVKPRKITVA
jgi:HSP20 family protein